MMHCVYTDIKIMSRSKYERIRVLIVDDDNLTARRLSEFIYEHGFEAQITNSFRGAKEIVLEWKPRFVLSNLLLPDGSAFNLIEFIKSEKNLRHQFIHVLIASGHSSEGNVRQALQMGAKDYIVKPFAMEDILKRLIFHSRSYKRVKDISASEYPRLSEAGLMLHLTDLVLKQALSSNNVEDILFNLTRMVSLKVDGVRCSIIQCFDQKAGVVVTSNDDRKASGISLDLYNYPEVLHVLNTQTLVAIENLTDSPELRKVREKAKNISFNSMIVCPVSRYGHPFGVLSLRMPPEKETLSDNEIRFVEIVAQVISLVLSNHLFKDIEDFWLKRMTSTGAPIPMRVVKNS